MTMNQEMIVNNRDIVPAHLAVKAMRDNGYKNAAYAIAELIDNSIQADADKVELLCGEKTIQLSRRTSNRIEEIAVLDNGRGMDENVLSMALQFGNGTRLEPENQKGIGKFGMGLPSSSISQCKRVDVWTWQDGIENAIYCYLDLSEITSGSMRQVPEPISKEVPKKWTKLANEIGNTGTLVVWTELDRIMWKTANAIIRNSEHIIGRMYRNFISDNRVSIRMYTYNTDHLDTPGEESFAKSNDPMYLMKGTSCPDPFKVDPMFEIYGTPRIFKIHHNDKEHEVELTFSLAKEEARQGTNPGWSSHGQHAAKNIGVSIVRAGRELELNESWAIGYDPTERWWGVQVEFPPSLDNVFGVSNNKQFARNFNAVNVDDFKLDGETVNEAKDRLSEEGDPNGVLLEIHQAINSNLSTIRTHLRKQRKGVRSQDDSKRYRHSAEKRATDLTKQRQETGYAGSSDDDENLPQEEREKQIRTELQNWEVSSDVVEGVIANTFNDGLKYHFVEANMDGSAFFTIRPKGGTIIIKLNFEHPAYKNLMELLYESTEDADEDELRERLDKAREGLQLLFMAWARYEDELEGVNKEKAQDVRHDWGRIARQFLERND
jgi:hypothetical protein